MENLIGNWKLVVIVVSILAWGIQIGLQVGQFRALRTDVGRLAESQRGATAAAAALEISTARIEEKCKGREGRFEGIEQRVGKLEEERRTA